MTAPAPVGVPVVPVAPVVPGAPVAGKPFGLVTFCCVVPFVPVNPFGPTPFCGAVFAVPAVVGNPFGPTTFCGVPGNPLGPIGCVEPATGPVVVAFGVPFGFRVVVCDAAFVGKPVVEVCDGVSMLMVGTFPDCARSTSPGRG